MPTKKTLEETIKELNKDLGLGTISYIKEDDVRSNVDWTSTGCFSLDRVFGKGMPKGRIVDIFGAPSGGKSTLAMFIVAQIQKRGGKAAWIDAEFSFTSDYAKKIGVNTEELLLVQPNCGEDAFKIITDLIPTGEVDIIVVDSTAALVPKRELEGEVYDHSVAEQARLVSKGLRMITGVSARTKTIVLFISQLRDKIGSFVGPTTDATGGKALKFYSSLRVEVTKIKSIKGKGEEIVGNVLKIKATKNKVSMPFRECNINLFFEKGIDIVGDILEVGSELGLVSKTGNTYSYGDTKLGVGFESAKDYLVENTVIYNKIKEEIEGYGKEDKKQLRNKKQLGI
jgi:recombination protein RecA